MTRLQAAIFKAGVAALLCLLAFAVGLREGRHAADLAHTQADATARELGHLAALERARATTQRATRTGLAREADRARVDTFFTALAEEARHDPPAAADACELPADRLRRWAEANAGPAHRGATPAQPDRAASAPAAASFGAHERPGGQPPAGDPRLPPAGQPAVPAAGVSGGGA